MKKLLFLVLVNLVLLSCTQDNDFEIENQKTNKENTSSRLAIGEQVKLIKTKDTRSYICRYETCVSYQMREYIVKLQILIMKKE